VAAEQDAARDRVLAARAALDEELGELRSSAKAAVDIPAKVRQSPAKAAAVAGGVAFVVLRGPQRIWNAVREKVFGKRARMPSRMLPKEIEKTLDRLGDDGDKVRGTLERDFADYVKEKQKERRGLIPIMALALARPVVARLARRAGEFLVSPSKEGYPSGLDEIRAKASAKAEEARSKAEEARSKAAARAEDARSEAAARADEARRSASRAADAAKERVDRVTDTAKERVDRVTDTAKERVDRVTDTAKERLDRARGERGPDEEPPTGV
jgi:hypothetical protein